MAGIVFGGRNHNAVYFGNQRIKSIYRGSALLWNMAPANALPLISGSWSAYGVVVSVDDSGIITLDGAPSISALFIRLTASYVMATSSTGVADEETVLVPAGRNIRFGVEHVDGSFTHITNSLNIVLRDVTNAAQFNCKLGDDIWTQEGVTPTILSCLCVYIRSGQRCTALRIRPFIELLPA